MPGEKYTPKKVKFKKTMPMEKPLSSNKQAKSGLPSLPPVRPTSMRNLSSWKGFNPGSY